MIFTSMLASPRRTLCGVVVFAMLACSPAVALAKPDDTARTRASAYQAETRAVLINRRWVINREQPGKLIASHFIGIPRTAAGAGGTMMVALVDGRNPLGEAHVTIEIQAVSATRTDCNASVVGYNYGKLNAGGHHEMLGPFALEIPGFWRISPRPSSMPKSG